MRNKQYAGMSVAIIILIAMFFFPETEFLTRAGINTIGMLIAFLIILITESLPVMLTCLIFLGLMPILGVSPNFTSALSGFSNQVVFFILASFGIAAAFTAIPLSKRILIGMLKVFGKNVKSMLFAMMLCSAVVSSVVSNVPTCAIFMAIGLSFLELYNDPEEKKRSGRAFMIGIPVASMIGGMMTPAGSSINLLAISLLEQYTGNTITFVQWMLAGIPLTILILPVSWWLIILIHKPAELNKEQVRSFINGIEVPKNITTSEIKVLIITGVMLVLWILSSWYRDINVVVVALLGCCLMCIPGVKVLKFKTFVKEISWESFFLVGSVLSMGSAMVNNGVSDWIITLFPTIGFSTIIFVGFTAAVIFLMLVFIPVSPSLVTIMATPLIALAVGAGASPVLLILVLGLCAGNCYLLPLDTVALLTYGTGYYSMKDMAKSSWPLQLWIIVVMALWLPVLGRITSII